MSVERVAKKPKVVITPALFKKFQAICEDLRLRWGLTDWAIHYRLIDLDDAYAQIGPNCAGRRAAMLLDKTWDRDGRQPSLAELRRIATHEMLHLLLADVISAAAEPGTSSDQAEEAAVRRLEHILLGPDT